MTRAPRQLTKVSPWHRLATQRPIQIDEPRYYGHAACWIRVERPPRRDQEAAEIGLTRDHQAVGAAEACDHLEQCCDACPVAHLGSLNGAVARVKLLGAILDDIDRHPGLAAERRELGEVRVIIRREEHTLPLTRGAVCGCAA